VLYTAQYRYPGQDRLDITVKGNDPAGKLFAPTWAMVKGVKDGTLSEAWYEETYYNLLIDRWHKNYLGFRASLAKLVDIVKGGQECFRFLYGMPPRDITLVCFCPAGTFCHRHLLVKFLQHNYAVEYGGERTGF
jgi:hypothetical protein